VLREQDHLVVRLYNPSSTATTARVGTADGPASGAIVDLDGNGLGSFTGETVLRPGEIVTLRVAY
jgi:hypothetical protein